MKKLIIACFIVFLPYAFREEANANGLTLDDIISETRILIQDNSSSTTEQFFSSTTLIRRANYIQDDMCSKTDAIIRREFITTSTGTRDYPITTTPKPLKIMNAYYEDNASTGTYRKIDYTTTERMDLDYSNWENLAAGRPLEWYQLFISTWATSEIRIGVRPSPTGTNVGSNKLRIDVSHLPTQMTSSTDIPFNDNPRLYSYHYIIVYGVAMLCTTGEERLYWKQIYDVEIANMKANLNDIPGRKQTSGIRPKIRTR
jgi:hypothetical protein